MTHYFDYKTGAVEFAKGWLNTLRPGLQLTMTITPGKLGGYYVSTVTAELSDDTELQTAKFFSDTQVNT